MRSRLTDSNLNSSLLPLVTNLNTNIEKLAKPKETQTFHQNFSKYEVYLLLCQIFHLHLVI